VEPTSDAAEGASAEPGSTEPAPAGSTPAEAAGAPAEAAGTPVEAISFDEVRHVAHLARLELTDDELRALQGELSSLLVHVDKIRRLHTEGVPPTAHPLPMSNVFRSDEPRPCLDRDEVLAGAPAVEDQRFLVPPILGETP